MFKRLFTAAIIFGAAALAPPAPAQSQNATNCLERAKLVAVLENTYREQPWGAGLQSTYQILEIWSSPETGSFTILVTYSNGTSCIVASGSYWQEALPPTPEETAG